MQTHLSSRFSLTPIDNILFIIYLLTFPFIVEAKRQNILRVIAGSIPLYNFRDIFRTKLSRNAYLSFMRINS